MGSFTAASISGTVATWFAHIRNGFDKVLSVFELAINTGKADVGNRIKFGEVSHNDFADLGGGHFGFVLRVNIGFDRLNNGFDHAALDVSFGACTLNPSTNLFSIKGFSRIVAFDQPHVQLLDRFGCHETPLARVTDPLSPDEVATLGIARVHNAIIVNLAVRTTHEGNVAPVVNESMKDGSTKLRNYWLPRKWRPRFGKNARTLLGLGPREFVARCLHPVMPSGYNHRCDGFYTILKHSKCGIHSRVPMPESNDLSNEANQLPKKQGSDRGADKHEVTEEVSGFSPEADGNRQPANAINRFRETVESKKREELDDDEAEETAWSGGFSPKAMVGTWALMLVLSVLLVVLSAVFEQVTLGMALGGIVLLWGISALRYGYRRLGYHYELTNQRFIHQAGLLHRQTDRIEVIDIDDVSFTQGPIQRIFGVGTITLTGSDRTHPNLSMLGISNVREVSGLIDDIRRKERRRRSLHIESI